MSSILSKQVMTVFREIDESIERLKQETGLSCPVGCGDCCQSPNVEAGVLELLPLAEMLFDRREAEHWLEELATRDGNPVCVFYSPDRLSFGRGRCAVYPYRPAMCRLFGYATVRDKHGTPVFAGCKVMKRENPESIQRAVEAAARNAEMPSITEAAGWITNLDPPLGAVKLSINDALGQALERVGLIRSLMCSDENDDVVALSPEDRPTPRSPRNAA